jgi:cytochrome c-type biogenesis protein CcsB
MLSLVIENCFQIRFTGCISAPIGIFITSFGNFYLPQNMQLAVPLSPALKSNWLSMHVTVMLLSYASLILGSVLGILFLLFANNKRISEIYNYYEVMKVDNYRVEYLYHREDTAFNYEIDSNNESRVLDFRINLLEGIDELSYRLIGFGFPLLTIGVISGAIWANEAWGQYWCWDPKEVWSLITWTIFAAYLHSRFINTWKGKKPAIIASFGFVAIWICYFGVNFLGLGLHTYGRL